MINCKNINPYGSKLRDNKVKYSTADGLYTTTNDVKVPFSMPEFSIRKIITHWFHVDNAWGDEEIGYNMIIVHLITVQLDLKDDFGRQVPAWDDTVVPMKDPCNLLEQTDLNKWDMREVVMHTVEPDPTRESTYRVVKIIDITYARAELGKVLVGSVQQDR